MCVCGCVLIDALIKPKTLKVMENNLDAEP